jgi:hypothetical protein
VIIPPCRDKKYRSINHTREVLGKRMTQKFIPRFTCFLAARPITTPLRSAPLDVWPDAPVARSVSAHRWTDRTRWLGQTSFWSLTLGALTERTDRTRWSTRDRVRCSIRSLQWPSFASVSFPTSGAVENRRFTSPKGAESRLASSAGGREEPKPLSTAQIPPPSQMC